MNPNIIKIDDTEYVRKDSIQQSPELNKDNYCIVRSAPSGVSAGYVTEKNLAEGWVKMKNARRLWYWDGAASIVQLAVDGVSKPQNCKFSVVAPEVLILSVCEIIPCTLTAIKSISEVKVWKA